MWSVKCIMSVAGERILYFTDRKSKGMHFGGVGMEGFGWDNAFELWNLY